MTTNDQLPQVLPRILERTAQIVEALADLDDAGLTAPSQLPGWSRLTIACHLRYGAEALYAMTEDTVQRRTTSYYPGGRARQRPGTLRPRNGEAAHDVVDSLASRGARLNDAWSALRVQSWHHQVVEPSDNPDLGALALSRLPLLRLTEVEVHGTDLGLHLQDWSTTFVEAALPMRLEALNRRTPNPLAVDAHVEGAWLLVASDGPSYHVSVTNGVVASAPAVAHRPSRAVVEATSRDLLALLLGRPLRHALRVTGDRAFGNAFAAAFPGP